MFPFLPPLPPGHDYNYGLPPGRKPDDDNSLLTAVYYILAGLVFALLFAVCVYDTFIRRG